jgi:predicted nucleic acid-binding protein
MSALVLDTTVLIDALRGRPAAARLRDLATRHEVLLTTVVNVEEIVRGLRPSEEAVADALFTAIRVLPVREPDARRAGAWRREHAARGIPLHQADCLIGADWPPATPRTSRCPNSPLRNGPQDSERATTG